MAFENIQLRRDTSANWTANNPILLLAETGWETDTLKVKLGDGVTAWNSLLYAVQTPILTALASTASGQGAALVGTTLVNQGADPTGVASSNTAIAAAIAAGVTDLHITEGAYRITSNVVIPNSMTLRFDDGAMFQIAAGVTLVIAGPIIAGPFRIFNCLGTFPANWCNSYMLGLFTSGGIVQFDTPGTVRGNQELAADCCPEWFGAQGLTFAQSGASNITAPNDDTIPVQQAFTFGAYGGRPVKFYRDYPVTTVTLTGSELFVDMQSHYLVGISTIAATNAILEIKCAYSTLKNIKVDGRFNANYQSGIQWYCNNLNYIAGVMPSFYPGFNRIEGIYVRWCLVGICVGALPSQGATYYAQGATVGQGIATDAPLSESYISGLICFQNVVGMHMAQPNGKITLVAPVITAAAVTGWIAGASSYYPSLIALHMVMSSELSIIGGSLENNITDNYGKLLWLDGAGEATGHGSPHFSCTGTAIETGAPICIDGDSRASFDSVQDYFGLQGCFPLFLTLANSTAAVYISNSKIDYPVTSLTTGATPLAMSVATYPTTGFTTLYTNNVSTNPAFTLNCNQVEFGDTPWSTSGSGSQPYVPLVAGIRIRLSQCWLTSYATGGITRLVSQWLNDDRDYLAGIIDQTASTLTSWAVGNDTAGTSGGWTFSVGSTASGNAWGLDSTSLPIIDSDPVAYALKMTSLAGNYVQATSPKFAIQAGKARVFRGWIKTGTTMNLIQISALFFRFTGGACSPTSSQAMFYGQELQFGASYQPFTLYFTPPFDCTQVEIQLYAGTGATLFILDPSLQ